MKNQKGMLVVEAVFIGLFVSMIGLSILSTPSWRVKKATEKCLAANDSDCEAIKGWSQEQLVEYLRDR